MATRSSWVRGEYLEVVLFVEGVVEAVEGGLGEAVVVDLQEVEQQQHAVGLVVLPPHHLQQVLQHQVEQLRPGCVLEGDQG